MRSARIGLALSILLALTGTAVAVQRAAAPRVDGRVATLATSAPPAPPPTTAPAPPLACHDHPVAAQAAGSPVAAPLSSANPKPAPAPTKEPAAPPMTAPAAVSTANACHPTPDQIAAAQKLVTDTRSAIVSRYAQTSDAVLAGYQPDGNDRSAVSRVWHYTNWQHVHDDGAVDPQNPDGLLYGRTEHHGLVLVGAFYLMPRPGMHGPDIGGCLTPWHMHTPGGPEMLHVWTIDMPGGPFTNDWDPNYIASL